MSSGQFAEMITSMNIGDGVPCTIESIQGKKKNYKQNSLNFEIIKQQYELLSTNQLAKMYNISVPTMLSYLKNKNIYKFRKNYL
jgi:hypothetical protein